jgi:S1-C subfamily serine protease
MKQNSQIKVFILFAISFLLQSLKAQDASSIYQTAVRSTVTIETDRSLGSGFFVGNHLIITCYHVVKGCDEIFFYTNSSENKYRIESYIKVDADSDLILLYSSEFSGVPLKISTIDPQPGQKVFTIGSPKGMDFSISDGIVSGIRKFNGLNLIQITAPISQGNSGGPVLDQYGAIMGVSVGNIPDAQNLNFCIPNTYIKAILSFGAKNPKPISNLTGRTYTSQKYQKRTLSTGFHEDAVLLALIEYAFPLVIDNAGSIIQIDARGKKPDYGELCYLFAADLTRPRLLAYGTITSINASICNVYIEESVSEFNEHEQFLILFAHELK